MRESWYSNRTNPLDKNQLGVIILLKSYYDLDPQFTCANESSYLLGGDSYVTATVSPAYE